MFSSVFIIIASIFVVDSAPKLGDLLFDPLEFEAAKNPGDVSSDDDFLENQPSTETTKQPPAPVIINQINIQKESKEKIKTKPFIGLPNAELIHTNKPVRRQAPQNGPNFGYAFDPSKCVVLNGDERVICGYDKNNGEIPKELPVDPYPSNNECRIRAGRIECGYVQGGYVMAARKALRVTPEVYSKISFASYPMSRITFPKVSPPLISSFETKVTLKPTSNLKLIANFTTPLPTTIRILIRATDISTSELASGKMTTTLLTSRSGIKSSKITAENKHSDTLPNPSYILKNVAPSPKLSKTTTLPEQREQLTMQEGRAIGRTGEERVAANVGGCSSCVLKSMLRGSGSEGGTTNNGVTRCVEINDRIVCYPVKTRSTTPIVAS